MARAQVCPSPEPVLVTTTLYHLYVTDRKLAQKGQVVSPRSHS